MSSNLEANLGVLRRSVDHLRELVAPLDGSALEASAYPSDWRVADVCSHIGSGAVIMQRALDDVVHGTPTPDDFAPSVWDTWNAKSPSAKAADALAADRDLVDRVTEMSHGDWSHIHVTIGPMQLDLPGFVAMRCNEHVLHTWDIEVTFDKAAVLPDDAAALIVDNLEMIARFTARPSGDDRTMTVATTDPARGFEIQLTSDAVTFAPVPASNQGLVLPAEAFIRLVYGRLDREHTPEGVTESDVLDQLRHIFPGL